MPADVHILIAEDDFEDRFIMSETFNELGYIDVVRLTEDGMQLIEYLNANGAETVKLIVLDLNMPRLGGTATLRILKNEVKYQHIPVIIFSTSVNHIEKNICLELGALDYISKPIKYSEYLEICKKLYSISQE